MQTDIGARGALIGSLVGGRFRVTASVAREATGIVVDAWDERDRRAVAIRVLDEPRCRDRAALERCASAARSVPLIHDIGALADGRLFVVLDRTRAAAAAIDDVLARAISVDPGERTEPLSALVDALARAVARAPARTSPLFRRAPVPAPPPARRDTKSEPIELPMRTPWRAVVVAALIVVLAIVVLIAHAPLRPARSSARRTPRLPPPSARVSTARAPSRSSSPPTPDTATTSTTPSATADRWRASSRSHARAAARTSRRAPESIAPLATTAIGPVASPPPPEDAARADALTNEATDALVKGLIPRAIELYREATIAARSFAPAWRGLGVANERIGRRAEALDAYDQYLALAGAAADAGSVRRRIERLKARSDRH